MTYPIIGLWAHMRARSTAFLRMMLERGDVIVIHEPLVTLADEGAVDVPNGKGGTITLTSEADLFAHLRTLARNSPVFFKDTVEHRYHYLFDHSEDLADITHTFIFRDPRPTINSVYFMKDDIISAQVGYENLWDLFCLVQSITGSTPFLMDGDQLVKDPVTTVRKFCAATNLAYLQHALTWEPSAQPVWQKTERWHRDVANSSGFHTRTGTYTETVDNNKLLNGFYRYHSGFYQRLLKYRTN